MKFVAIALFALLFIVPAQKSEAFVYGEDYSLSYVGDTEWLDDRDQPMSLCVLQEYWHIMWIPVWSSYEYALAVNECDTDSIYQYREGELAQEIANGQITVIDDPVVPMSLSRILWGYTGLIIIGIGMLFGLLAIRRANKRSARRAELTSHIPANVRGPLAFCLQAAMSDGTADDSELAAIVRALKEVYRTPMTVPQLREIVQNTDMDANAPEIKEFLTGATGDQKHEVLRLLVMVTAADGKLEEAEMKFAVESAQKLGFTQADVAQVFNAMSGGGAAPDV